MDLDEALEIEDALGLGRYGDGPGQKNQDGEGRKGQEQGGALHMCVPVHFYPSFTVGAHLWVRPARGRTRRSAPTRGK